uniref:Immunoglobulin V-set domain-containing protein n=1 Tax=Maylandia zebra TaxID=106582 RepID=A0A3P9BGA7_9CICH
LLTPLSTVKHDLFTLYFFFLVSLRCVTSAVGMIHVTGYVGREVNVSCSYDQSYVSHEKYLCKNGCGSSDVLITTPQASKTKYSIYDDNSARIFTTTIFDLQSTDAGKYWCGVTIRRRTDIYTEVELKLVQGKKKRKKKSGFAKVNYRLIVRRYHNK